MTMLLLASLIDGLSAFDLVSVGPGALASGLVPGLADAGLLKLTVVHGHGGLADAAPHWIVLAQQFDTDVFSGFRAWWSDFVSSGKIWTLIFGIVLGYLLRALTTYG
ncbi:MAG: hypothetical protein AAF289_00210 [Cyanobacteria bacterium P01_A01_bin.135]